MKLEILSVSFSKNTKCYERETRGLFDFDVSHLSLWAFFQFNLDSYLYKVKETFLDDPSRHYLN